MQESILQSVGHTPLVRLRRLTEGLSAAVYVKVDALNPGGSVKDRVAVAMIAEAERSGHLRPAGTIIEATAGNTGVGIAIVAAVKGYRCILVLTDKMSTEKISLLKAYAAEVVIMPTSVGTAESFHVAREMARCEGLLLGGSSGSNVAAALRYARRLSGDQLVVALGCDTGRNYLSKFYDDQWLAENQLTKTDEPAFSIADLLKTRGRRDLVTTTPESTVASTIELIQARGISQVPVLADGKPVGSVQEVTIARVLHDSRDPEHVRVGEIMARPLPTLDVNTHLDEAYRMLMSGHSGVLATSDGKVIDIVTRIDLVQYWQNKLKAKG